MNSTITKILFEKIFWIVLNLFWVIPALITLYSFFIGGDDFYNNGATVVPKWLFFVGLTCFLILSIGFVFNLCAQKVLSKV